MKDRNQRLYFHTVFLSFCLLFLISECLAQTPQVTTTHSPKLSLMASPVPSKTIAAAPSVLSHTPTSAPTVVVAPTNTFTPTPGPTCTPWITGSCETCANQTYKPGRCIRDENSVVTILEPEICRCKTSQNDNTEICNGDCAAVAARFGLSTRPVVQGEKNCHEAQRQWCRFLARRWKKETDAGTLTCLGCQTEEDEMKSAKEGYKNAPRDQREAPENCDCVYPRFTGAKKECPRVQLSAEDYLSFRKRFENYWLERLADICDFGAPLLGEEPVRDIDPKDFGLPEEEYNKFLSECNQHSDFWAAMSCLGKNIQEYYDSKENRKKNFNGKPDGSDPTNCIECRHYAATFVIACNKLLKEKKWKASCSFGRNASHAWPEITVYQNGTPYHYVYDITNDWGCINLIPKPSSGFENPGLQIVPIPDVNATPSGF